VAQRLGARPHARRRPDRQPHQLHPETAVQELQRLQGNLPRITTQLQALEQELLKMPDNGEGFGFGPAEQAAAVRKAIAQLGTR
jgi:hypothetical protein